MHKSTYPLLPLGLLQTEAVEAAETVGPSANALLLETDPAARGPREQCEQCALTEGRAAADCTAPFAVPWFTWPCLPCLHADELHYAELALIQIGQALELKRLLSEELVRWLAGKGAGAWLELALVQPGSAALMARVACSPASSLRWRRNMKRRATPHLHPAASLCAAPPCRAPPRWSRL